MIVSWDWLKQYVALDMPDAELERRLMMAGLNHESTTEVGGDLAIDLEVTSNRPDCLGHLGIAREVAVLFGRELKLPQAAPKEGATPVARLTDVRLECPELCPRYTARVIQGAKIAESPRWLKRRLATVGIAAINNVVDVTNYVMLECGQPLHAFDLARLAERRIVVRGPLPRESFVAINHKTYELTSGICVIADGKKAVALGGVMGGADSEVSADTTDLLIEAAEFDPVSIRNTARLLNLHSPSSHRFERGIDPDGVDWASRRACELILELAGGELAAGAIDVGRQPPTREPIALRLAQLKRILGIEIDADEVVRILAALGLDQVRREGQTVRAIPPGRRRDLTREIDLVEEVGRIHGYDAVPEDVRVPMVPSARNPADRTLEKIRHSLTAAGYDEAYTLSVVEPRLSEAFSPWTDAQPLTLQTPILRSADRLRRSLVPSLLAARRTNESLANPVIELFEIAKVYLPRPEGLPDERLLLALTSGGDFFSVKGALSAVFDAVDSGLSIEPKDTSAAILDSQQSARLESHGRTIGYLGELSAAGRKQFELKAGTTIAEIDLTWLLSVARPVARYRPQSTYPAIQLDLNLELAESVRWSDVAAAVRATAGPLLEALEYRETYRDEGLTLAGKKSLLFSLSLRDESGTLTKERAEEVHARVVAACEQALGARLRA